MPELPQIQCRPLAVIFDGSLPAEQTFQFESGEVFDFEDGIPYQFENL